MGARKDRLGAALSGTALLVFFLLFAVFPALGAGAARAAAHSTAGELAGPTRDAPPGPAADRRFDPEAKDALGARAADSTDNCTSPADHYPAFDPDPAYDVTHYEIRLDLTPPTPFLSGRTTIEGVALHAGLDLVALDFCGPGIDSVRVDGQPATWTWEAGVLTVSLGTPLPPSQPFSVSVSYSGMTSGTRGLLFPAVSDSPQYATTYSFSEPEDARTWYPCHDVPSDKATLDMIVTVPADLVVGSNGVLVEESPVAGNRRLFHWKEIHPISTYLVSVAIARYAILHDDRIPGLPITNYVYKPDSAAGVVAFENVPEMIQYFSGLFGPYDFDKYGHAVAPFPGGMEHQSLTTVGRIVISYPTDNQWVVAHELAHQWWGDALTLKDWRHIWLNEGFASYGDALWGEHVGGREGLNARMNIFSDVFKFGYLDRGLISTVVDPPASRLFGFTVYDKGAWILHTLRHVMGDSAFFEALRQYHAAHLYGNVVTEDFIAACEAVHGADLDWYFTPWLYEPGLPQFVYSWRDAPFDSGGTELTVVVSQKQASPFYPLPVDFAILSGPDTLRTTVFLDTNPDTFHVVVAETPPDSGVILDPDNWILKTVDFEGANVPVALTAFSATREAGDVLIRWSVTEEGRRSLYRVYRSSAGTAVRQPIQEAPLTGFLDYMLIDRGAPEGDLDYWIEVIPPDGLSVWYGPLHLAREAGPSRLFLAGNRPNPFRQATVLAYSLPEAAPVRLSVHDVTGRLVRMLVEEPQPAGSYEVSWDGQDASGSPAPPGVYFVKLDAGGSGSRTGRLVRVR